MKRGMKFWSESPNRDARILLILWVTTALLLLVTVLHVYSLEKGDRLRVLAAADRDLSNLTRVSQEHASRTFRSADQVIRFVRSRYLAEGSKLNLYDLTARGVIDSQIFNQVGLIDEKGIYILSNLPMVEKVDLSDRDHFKVHIARDTGEMFVSKPVLGRASGKWSIQLSRRINRADGSFAGVVVVSIDPGYFTRFYADLDLGAKGMAALYGMDGIARARMVGEVADFGAKADKSPVFSLLDGGVQSGSYTQSSVVDGIERLYFYRKVPGFSLVVFAGTELRYLLAGHVAARDALYLQSLLLSVVILFLSTSLTYYLQKIRKETASRRLAQQQNQERTLQLSAIFSMSPDGFVSFDESRRIKYVNPSFGRMTDLDPEGLQGLDEADFSARLAAQCVSGARFKGVGKLSVPGPSDGSMELDIIEVAATPKRLLQVGTLQGDTASVPLILYFRDVTQEIEVGRMKSEFLSTAAHELRTPMASIYGFVEIVLADPDLSDTHREYLEIAYRQAQVMAHILNDLLDLARIEERQGSDFHYTPVNLQDLLHSVVKALPIPEGRDRPGLDMPVRPLVVSADEGKLRQVMVNILSNAYKFSPDGGSVAVALEVQQLDGVRMACMQVADQGIGMSAQQMAQVFTRFYRADASGRISGTGLGMSIVKEIVNLHHGQVSIASNLGTGTRVNVFLPPTTTGTANID